MKKERKKHKNNKSTHTYWSLKLNSVPMIRIDRITNIDVHSPIRTDEKVAGRLLDSHSSWRRRRRRRRKRRRHLSPYLSPSATTRLKEKKQTRTEITESLFVFREKKKIKSSTQPEHLFSWEETSPLMFGRIENSETLEKCDSLYSSFHHSIAPLSSLSFSRKFLSFSLSFSLVSSWSYSLVFIQPLYRHAALPKSFSPRVGLYDGRVCCFNLGRRLGLVFQ